MKENELRQYLRQQYPREDATCEWKAFSTFKNNIAGRKGEDLVSYISAIANIHGGHLVIGVEDQTLNILGIQDFQDYTPENLPHRLMGNCTNLSSEMLWVEAFETEDSHKIVWIVHIPKHLPRKPVYAHRVAWQRIGDSLVPMSPEREHHILTEPMPLRDDWSAGIVPTATIDDLDERALRMAREKYSEKYRHISAEIDLWDTMTFLNKAKLSIKGQITRAALLLLGKSESEHFVAPADAKIRWILKSTDNRDLDWQVFNIPFILAVDGVYGKIRNLMYRYLPDGTLFPDEVLRFEPFTIREALCNCIAHQDYTLSGRINVIQKGDDELIFTNQGYFLPPSVEKLVEEDTPQDEYYRNRFLVEADEYYKNLILEYVKKFGTANRNSIEKLLWDKLPEILSEKQRKIKINNLLSSLKRSGKIENKGTLSKPIWTMVSLIT